MANTKRKPSENKKSTASWHGFVRCDLTRHDKDACREFLATTEIDVVLQWFSGVVDDFKVSLSHDFDHDCYIASMTGAKHAEEMYAGWTLTSRGKDWETALAVLMYKHEEMLQRDWTHENDGYPEEGDRIG